MDVKFRPLVTVIALTAVATSVAQLLPPSRELRGLALLLDVAPLGGVILATVIFMFQLRRARVPVTRGSVAIYAYFAGALIATLGVAHLTAVVVVSLERWRQHQFAYSFHFYSLVVLGVLLGVAGVRATVEAAHLSRGRRGGWRQSLLVWTAILAINLPLVPLQGFAVGLSVLAVLALLLLIGMRRHFAAEQEETIDTSARFG